MEIVARDLIAALILIGCFILKYMGEDGFVSMIIVAIVAFYFGGEFLTSKTHKNRE